MLACSEDLGSQLFNRPLWGLSWRLLWGLTGDTSGLTKSTEHPSSRIPASKWRRTASWSLSPAAGGGRTSRQTKQQAMESRATATRFYMALMVTPPSNMQEASKIGEGLSLLRSFCS